MEGNELTSEDVRIRDHALEFVDKRNGSFEELTEEVKQHINDRPWIMPKEFWESFANF